MATDKLVDFDHVTDYISREAALSCFSDWIDRYGHEHTADEIVEYQKIEDLPTADVRPVVRGRWEPGETVFFCGVEYTAPRTCSVCGRSALDEPWYFCPNCGADMREATP